MRQFTDVRSTIRLELLNTERDYLPALVCLSQAYLMLKQAPKARNHLKRVAKMAFMADQAGDFERGWHVLHAEEKPGLLAVCLSVACCGLAS